VSRVPDVAVERVSPPGPGAGADGAPITVGSSSRPERVSPPGPGLAAELAGVALDRLDEFGLVEVMRDGRRLTAWAESVELAAMAELDRRRQAQAGRNGLGCRDAGEALVDEIAAALTLSGTAAAIRLGLAIALERLLPETGRALAESRIDSGKAKVLADGIIGLSVEVARGVERLLLPEAPRLTTRHPPGQLPGTEKEPGADEETVKVLQPGNASQTGEAEENGQASQTGKARKSREARESGEAREPGKPSEAPRHDTPEVEHSIQAAAITEVVREQFTELLGQVRDSGRTGGTRLAEAATGPEGPWPTGHTSTSMWPHAPRRIDACPPVAAATQASKASSSASGTTTSISASSP
jgi:hypothetical protein